MTDRVEREAKAEFITILHHDEDAAARMLAALMSAPPEKRLDTLAVVVKVAVIRGGLIEEGKSYV